MFFPPLLAPGSPAPAFRLLDQRSHTVGLPELEGPNGLVLLFFTTGRFGQDARLLSAYRDAATRLKAAGLEIAAISAANWETLHHLSQDLNLPYPVLFDACARVSMRYGAVMIPRFVTGMAVLVLSPDGTVRLARKGYMDPAAALDATVALGPTETYRR